MEAGSDETTAALQALARTFEASPEMLLARTDRLTREDVRQFLIPRITALLDRNPELLMHILYRVDVAEADVKRVFAESVAPDLPARLADLLIERQLLKLRFRRQYRGEGL